MAGKIFVNYRRDDSIDMADRLCDRLAQAFGRKNLFAGSDDISPTADYQADLNNQLAACQVFLTVIGPNWLEAKNEAGQRPLHDREHSVAIEISAALARNIPVIPVLVDGARMPDESELPDFLKPLSRHQAAELRDSDFDQDADALVERVRPALNGGSVKPRSSRRKIMGVMAAAVLIFGWVGLHNSSGWPPWVKFRDEAKVQAEAEAKRKSAEAGQQRLEALKAEQERQATAAAEAEAKRKSEEAERLRLAALRAEEERNRAEAEAQAEARYSSLITQGDTDYKAGNYDRAISSYNEALRLDPKSALLLISRGNAYRNKGDHGRAIADFNEAIQLDPKNALAFVDRGDSYTNRGDNDRAIADFNEALRLDPKNGLALSNRGVVYGRKGDHDRAIADFDEAIRLDPKSAHAFRNRGIVYSHKGDNDRAIADFNEAIRLDPNNALAFCSRGIAKLNINDVSGNADIAKARTLEPSSCR